MRILVTGGAGLIGSHLCEKLLIHGEEVLCVDNFYTSSKKNIKHLLSNSNFELVRHDITVPLYIECDAIYNLACPASPIHYQRDPVQTLKTCVHGAINMLGLAKRLKIPILQASTSEIYGDSQVHPQHEAYFGNVNPIGKRSCYDEGKRCAETLFFDYWRQYNLDIKIVRIFNTYGPRMSREDGRVISNFVIKALKNEPLQVSGDGQQTRSFCYISDLVDGLIKMMASSETGPINLGNPQEVKILDLAYMILQICGSDAAVNHLPTVCDDPRHRRPDITLAVEKLNWRPTTSLEDGLLLTRNYFT